MAPILPSSVTIDRAYFETILRRANYNHDIGAFPFSTKEDTIIPVSKEEYENLLLVARQFANLKRSLLGAGVTEENIATLVQDSIGSPETSPYVTDEYPYVPDQPNGGEYLNQGGYQNSPHHTNSYRAYGTATRNTSGKTSWSKVRSPMSEEDHEWGNNDHLGDSFPPSHLADGPADGHIGSFARAPGPQPASFPRMCKRTVTICGIPSSATLADVTGVVRGGQLLDVFLRSVEHLASVSFVREEDATRFYEHAKKNDIYIKDKRVWVRWPERQFILSAHVANKLASGVSRNMIIRRCAAQHTEDSVREDLEHIHNLAVIKVEFVGGSCYIKTNSVHNAMFARTCMMSRAKYKGSKIEWDVDECDRPFEPTRTTQPHLSQQRRPPVQAAAKKARNRFDMLRLDDEDNDESGDNFDTSSEMTGTV
ncbi:hypothetical protein GGS20DRAFT_583163 [Poronia punctata]|nr:hypothetical protein GGS20DRAFT_583163 [Poronia punctata]